MHARNEVRVLKLLWNCPSVVDGAMCMQGWWQVVPVRAQVALKRHRMLPLQTLKCLIVKLSVQFFMSPDSGAGGNLIHALIAILTVCAF